MLKTICLFLLLLCSKSSNSQDPPTYSVIINEILFNPVKDGYDYVEGYNNGSDPIYLNEILVAGRDVTNDITGVKIITKDTVLLNPGSYFVLTTNDKWLKQNYAVPTGALVIRLPSMPSLPDDEGSVVFIRKKDSLVIDELHYNAKWHFQLISNPSGIALERINYFSPTQDENNWTSASSTSGFGTPGYINSQFRKDNIMNTEVSVAPKVFSPDNDGTDDLVQIVINPNGQGFIANAIIFDANGKRVKYLIKNATLGTNNTFKWDGCDDRSQKLPTGMYVIFTQIFDLKGNISKYRKCIVLNGFK